MSKGMLRAYTRGDDGIYRRRVLFSGLGGMKPNVAHVRVLVRNAEGWLLRVEKHPAVRLAKRDL